MAIAHVVYHSAEATDPYVNAHVSFETRLHFMRNIVFFFTLCFFFVIAAEIYKQIKCEKSQNDLCHVPSTHSKALFVPRGVTAGCGDEAQGELLLSFLGCPWVNHQHYQIPLHCTMEVRCPSKLSGIWTYENTNKLTAMMPCWSTHGSRLLRPSRFLHWLSLQLTFPNLKHHIHALSFVSRLAAMVTYQECCEGT